MPIPTHTTFMDFARAIGSDPSGGVMEGASAHRIEVIHPSPSQSETFRTGYFTLVLFRTGRGRYWLDGTVYATRPGTVYFTNPGHAKAFANDAPSTGWVLTFTEAFLKTHARVDIFGELPFLLAETAPPFHADADTFAALDAQAEQVAAEIARPSSIQAPLVAALFVALLLRFREAFWDDYDPIDEGDRGSEIVRTFRRDLEVGVRALVAGEASFPPSVTDLADAQGLHPNYLSTVVKSKTGRSVGDWTAEKMAAEARGLLAGSRAPVKEIAYTLGYSEPTAFSRFFKQQTGETPTTFRRRSDAAQGTVE